MFVLDDMIIGANSGRKGDLRRHTMKARQSRGRARYPISTQLGKPAFDIPELLFEPVHSWTFVSTAWSVRTCAFEFLQAALGFFRVNQPYKSVPSILELLIPG